MTTFLFIVLGAVALWVLPYYWRLLRRRQLRGRPLNRDQERFLGQSLRIYKSLPLTMQAQLRGEMSLFLQQKEFVGCDGLEVSEYMRIAVAAHACLLLLGRDTRCYPDLYTVLLYPDTYVAREIHRQNYVETTRHSVREGESHYRGPVVISWRDLEQDLAHPELGHNVALHEFAHKLDEEDGYYDGRPVFESSGEGRDWAEVFGAEFRHLRQQRDSEGSQNTGPRVLDLYGAESPAEFFAVATEAFFVIPAALSSHHSALYRELRNFYRIDPAVLYDTNSPAQPKIEK
ncbi:zinc-dependent peptidase [Microbulbifer sp. TYP-18]|uniref:zinc-dependent peptidase n=1 Tax=Microbulbifer sp. TYP-18 TaxID=3230024 RepID=UPI0034C6CFBE